MKTRRTQKAKCKEPECPIVSGMDEHTHTPTPWKVQDEYEGIFPIDAWNGEESIEICRVSHDGIDDAEQKANAAFIVRAANSHEELVSIAKMYLEILEADESTPQDILKSVRKTIAKAEGGI